MLNIDENIQKSLNMYQPCMLGIKFIHFLADCT